MDLVEVKNHEVFCDSHVVAKKFDYKPNRVVKLIKDVARDLEEIEGVHSCTPKCITEERAYRGQSYTVYLMNRDFFSLLVMRFRGKDAFAWQFKFIASFNAMEQRLLLLETNKTDQQWLGQREQSKIARREETDVIKEFVEYATAQGSQSAMRYYGNLTRASYKALDLVAIKNQSLRDTLNLYQLAQLTLVEKVAQDGLKKYMGLGRHYKDIYTSVRDDLLSFGAGLRIDYKVDKKGLEK